MCDITMALTIGSTLLGAAGAVQQGQAAAASSRYTAQVSEMNATLADRRARDALERGAVAEQRKRQEAASIVGKQTAAMAANGVDITFGSPLDTLVDTAVAGELDALTIRTNSAREAYDYRVQASNQRANAGLQRSQADSAETGGYLKAAGTILGGAGKAYGQGVTASYGGSSYGGTGDPTRLGSLY
ncbi:virion core protein, T7 gp14 family [Bradyrhizobium sp. HKCCYLS2038]|uniref:virion core protein, T7 gp14 family n=1 Tax=Bradyrhizobium sp. HKCCYLS2038 TaxID=3420764 RepID=UPI003EBF107C